MSFSKRKNYEIRFSGDSFRRIISEISNIFPDLKFSEIRSPSVFLYYHQKPNDNLDNYHTEEKNCSDIEEFYKYHNQDVDMSSMLEMMSKDCRIDVQSYFSSHQFSPLTILTISDCVDMKVLEKIITLFDEQVDSQPACNKEIRGDDIRIKFNNLIKKRLHKDEKIKDEENEYVSVKRIKELSSLKNDQFDLSKLLVFCKEMNTAWKNECYFTVGMLLRAIMDHTFPIFGKNNFEEIANNYSTADHPNDPNRSFKDKMKKLLEVGKVADGYLHEKIRKKEPSINRIQVDYKAYLDCYLQEIIRILSVQSTPLDPLK